MLSDPRKRWEIKYKHTELTFCWQLETAFLTDESTKRNEIKAWIVIASPKNVRLGFPKCAHVFSTFLALNKPHTLLTYIHLQTQHPSSTLDPHFGIPAYGHFRAVLLNLQDLLILLTSKVMFKFMLSRLLTALNHCQHVFFNGYT